MYQVDRYQIWYFSLAIGVTTFVGMGCLSRRSYQNQQAAILSGQNRHFLENLPVEESTV